MQSTIPIASRMAAGATLLMFAACASSPWPAVPETAPPTVGAPDHRAEALRLAAALDAGATDVDTIVWYGRRLAYLGDVDGALAVFTHGLELHPDEPHLLRHRGHRWITVRRFDRAAADLERAAAMLVDRPDEVEPDGIPNARGIPTSTLRTNVYYHLGLVRRFTGQDDAARVAFEACRAAATTVDMEVAARYWLALSYWRLGQPAAARAVVADVPVDAEIVENHAYHALALLFAGRLDEADVDAGDAPEATVAYGIGCHCFTEGRIDDGLAWLARAAASTPVGAFGRIAAETDLARFAAVGD